MNTLRLISSLLLYPCAALLVYGLAQLGEPTSIWLLSLVGINTL
ncbi:hypothetical protein GCM10023069_50930 [Shinella granuli]|uniref:Uncharacterized protein n=1 Tax=Shinella granuli TaxID=323621 RepID=A0A4R2CMI7_SHIGR|nr:hypothetical protein EV665_112163 [Shinella granuli]